MTFKMVTESEKAAGRIAGVALAHAEMIAGEQTTKWRDQLPEGQNILDAEQVQRFHAEELFRLRDELLAKEAVHLNRLKDIREARERRDAAAPRLRARLYAMRDLFKGVYGDKGPRALFLGKPVVPVDATPLRRVAHIVADNLENSALELPPATLQGTRLTRSELAGEIRKPLKVMAAAMQELEGLLPLATKSLEEKRRAHAAVDEKSGKLARFLEGLYELEGHDVLAAKVRPSSHQRKDSEAAESAEGARGEEAREAVADAPAPVTPELVVPELVTGETPESSGPIMPSSAQVVVPQPAVASKILPQPVAATARAPSGPAVAAVDHAMDSLRGRAMGWLRRAHHR